MRPLLRRATLPPFLGRAGRFTSRASRTDWLTRAGSLLLLAVLLALQILDPPIVEAARLRVFDQLQKWRPRPVPAQSPVAIVDIDEESLTEIGQWPWPRQTFADLIANLGRQAPRAIVFDVLFAEADRLSPPSYARLLEPLNARAAAIVRALPSFEESMAAALRAHTVVLGEAGATMVERRFSRGIEPPARIAWLGSEVRHLLPTFPYAITPLPLLAGAAKGLGMVSILPEVDGIVRRAPTLAVVGDHLLPGLAVEALRVALGVPTVLARGNANGMTGISIGPVTIPTDIDGRLWIHYTARRPELYLSASRVLAGEIPPESVAGKIVFIGSSAVSIGDIKVTPVVGNLPGVEVQALLAESILSGDVLQRPPALIGAEVALVLVLGLALALFGLRLPAGSLPPLLLAVLASAAALAWLAYRQGGYLVDATYPAFALGLLLFWLAMAKYIREETSRRSLRHAFGHYLSPVMVDRLTANPTALTLEGDKRPLTVLFSDIRGFTTLTEVYAEDPEGLTKLLNRYFTGMTDEILAQEGTIDKYIGDAIMAFWNAPLDDPRHARHACLAALAMLARLDAFNRELAAEAEAAGTPFTPLRIGIGIETGSCFVGNLGSRQRFNYSVIGDAVNVAARLESASKTYAFPVIVGGGAARACPELAFLPVEVTQLRGKRMASQILALLGDETLAGKPAWPELVAAHEALLEAARGRRSNLAAALAECRRLAQALGLGADYDRFLELQESGAAGTLPAAG